MVERAQARLVVGGGTPVGFAAEGLGQRGTWILPQALGEAGSRRALRTGRELGGHQGPGLEHEGPAREALGDPAQQRDLRGAEQHGERWVWLLAMGCSRRAFLAGAGLLPFARLLPQDPAPAGAPVPRRALGRTGLEVPILGLGTHPLSTLPDEREEEALALLRRAFALGVRYFDTAPSYTDHRAERRIGAALGAHRDEIVLATKSYRLPRSAALRELEDSLRSLGTDRVDVFQVHAVGDGEDRRRKLDPDTGVLAAALQAQKEGKCRFVGVTGHADPEVVAACLQDHRFDTVLVPVNCADPLWLSFVTGVLPVARARGTAVVAMKVFASGRLLAPGSKVSAAECLRWSLSQDVAVAVPGCRTVAELETDAAAVRPFRPMDEAAQRELTARVGEHPGNALEWYKREPQGR